MEELPPRPNRTIIPNIELITSDPFLQMVMADHYKSPDIELYKSNFANIQDEIVESMHDMSFRKVRNEEQLNILNADVIITPATTNTGEVATSSNSGKARNPTSE